MKHQRIRIRPGLSIYLRWHRWWVDANIRGRRLKRPLNTTDPEAAVQKAKKFFRVDGVVPPNETLTGC